MICSSIRTPEAYYNIIKPWTQSYTTERRHLYQGNVGHWVVVVQLNSTSVFNLLSFVRLSFQIS